MSNISSEATTTTPSYSTTPLPSISPSTTHNVRVPGSEIVLPLGVSLITLSCMCTSYVIIRTLIRWWITRRSLSMALRVPFYIAISDFVLVCTYLPNLVYSLIHGHPWPEAQCRIIGGFTFFFISCNMTLVGLLAFLTYLRICRRWYLDLGKYDYKLFSVILVSSLVFTIVGIPSFGTSKYWCFTNHNNAIMPIITLVLNFTILSVTLFSYTMTLRQINSINFRRDNGNKFDTVATRSKQIEPIVIRKVIGYVLIFLLQWTPPMIYVFGQVINYDEMWIYIVTDATINLGGVGNMIQYIINEGWWDGYGSSSGTSVGSNSTPPTHNIFGGTLSSSVENARKSRVKVNADGNSLNGELSPSKMFPSGHISQITVEEVVTVVIEDSPSTPSTLDDVDLNDGDVPMLFRSRPNSCVTFSVDREDASSRMNYNSPVYPMMNAPSPAITTATPSTIISATPSQTISNTPSQTISNTSSQKISTTSSQITNNKGSSTPIADNSDRIHVSELEQVIIRHDKALLKHGGNLERQGSTMLNRDHSLKGARSVEEINRSIASIQSSNYNGNANVGIAEGAGNGGVNRSKSLNSGSLSRGGNGRSESESSNKDSNRGEGVVNEEDDHLFM
ncbi:4933_t:CDS:2 [Acaulospora morrowiae]|uniref:4933_t:CDS:1 n=1 Tax=Acaulospora morrowiae TaxID=94023 RepID=A0A9N9H1S9_9GLOM|nr:4933_t:CDS:2 [Acaulospora morrowiae]